MSSKTISSAVQVSSVFPTVTQRGLTLWLTAPRSRYITLQSLVGIALSYELLFGNETVVSRGMAELTVAGLLAAILGTLVLPRRVLETDWFVNALVGFETFITVGAVYLAGNAREDFYLTYFLLILIATSVQTLGRILKLSAVVCLGYGLLMAEDLLTTGQLSVGQLMGLPVLMMMGVFYGLTLEELGAERRRGEKLSHRLAELRFEEEHLLLTRDRLLHETARLKLALTAKRGSPADVLERVPATCQGVSGDLLERQRMERMAGQVATMLQDVARQMGREIGALRAKITRDDPRETHVDHLLLAGERAATVAAQLQTLVRSNAMKRELCSLNETLVQLESTMLEMLPENMTLGLDLYPEDGFIEADPEQVEQIVLHLVMNARDAMTTGGHLVLATRVGEEGSLEAGPGGKILQLVVRDSGCGMSVETQSRVLEPFYTTKTHGRAWGMGLTTVSSLVSQSGGTVSFTSRCGHGTDVVVGWPRAESSRSSKAGSSLDAGVCANGTETVLVVEEDEGLRKWTAAGLRRARYQVLEAQSGVEGLLLAQRYPGAIQLLIGNLVMADMAGDELAERLLGQRPRLKALFSSNYPEDVIKSHRISPRCYLQKPYRRDDLLRKVRDILGVT